MKIIKLSILALSTSLISATALAAPNKLTALSSSSAATTIFNLFVSTPNSKKIPLDKVTFSAGTSQTAPCSDLKIEFSQSSTPDNQMTTTTETIPLTAHDLTNINEGLNGEATCIKWDLYFQGNDYSTGNIQLLMDQSGNYTGANPSSKKLVIQ